MAGSVQIRRPHVGSFWRDYPSVNIHHLISIQSQRAGKWTHLITHFSTSPSSYSSHLFSPPVPAVIPPLPLPYLLSSPARRHPPPPPPPAAGGDGETAAILSSVQERWLLHYCSPGNNSCHRWGRSSGRNPRMAVRFTAGRRCWGERERRRDGGDLK